jgi:uncharacterized protein (DUF1800 family)
MALLDPYTGSWTESEASHLLRRAGFGGSKADRQSLAALGCTAAVASLTNIAATDPYLDGPSVGLGAVYGAPFVDLPTSPPTPLDFNTAVLEDLWEVKNATVGAWLRGHWFYRMRYSKQPFQEQLALFLHDHAPSGLQKLQDNTPNEVNNGNDGNPPPGVTQTCTTGTLAYDPNRKQKIAAAALRDQINLYRVEGVDNFDGLLLSIVYDTAMLSYLDNFLNRAGRPQENLARELMELFSLGVGNYNELDVFELAKCLTGEGFPNFSCANDYNTTSGFVSFYHEPGTKTLFSVSVPFNSAGQETVTAIQLIASKNAGLAPPNNTLPRVAVHMAWKFLTWFVNHDVQLNPPDPAVLELAAYLAGSDGSVYPNRRYPYDVKAALGKLFRSQYFYDSSNRYVMYKTPPDFIIGALKALEASDFMSFNGIGRGALQTVTRDMGMNLFEPPDVSGWLHGKQWLSSSSLLARYNFANQLGQVVLQAYPASQAWVDALAPTLNDHAGMINLLADLLFHQPPTAEETATLTTFLATLPLSDLGADTVRQKRRKIGALAHVMMTMPIFQLK